MRDYPRWMHHESGSSRIVETPEEEAALGEGWSDYPAGYEVAEPLEPEAAVEALADHDEVVQ